MEFLFAGHIASIEALIVFACILIVFGIFSYDGYLFLREHFAPFLPKKNPLSGEVSRWWDLLEEVSLHTPLINIAEETQEEIIPTHTLETPSPETLLLEEESSPLIIEEAQETIDSTLPETVEDSLPEALWWDTTPIQSHDIQETLVSENISLEDQDETPPTEKDAPLSEDTGSNQSEQREVLDTTSPVVSEEVPLPIREEAKTPPNEPIEITTEPIKHHRRSKKEKLLDIVNNVKTLIARGQMDDARALLVSGLAIEKDHRELNIIMASLYERDHAFTKAEYVLKDIAMTYPDDIEILTHLATDLAMQRKYEVSYEIYKKILSLGGGNEETLYTLTHLASEMDLPLDVTSYARSYLKQYPHNPDILWLYSQSQITNGERRDAIDTLIKLKNLTPYNQEIADLIQKLVTEEELAGNFGHANN